MELNGPDAGLGLHQLGGRAQQWLAWKLKSMTQLFDFWLLICVLLVYYS
jgi:hypothetical protein